MTMRRGGMARAVLWTSSVLHAVNHVSRHETQDSVRAVGSAIGQALGHPHAVRYDVTCGPHWCVRTLHLEVHGAASVRATDHADGRGRWTGDDGAPLPDLDGCLDVKLSGTPFTNLLPIRRLRPAEGECARVLVAYWRWPDLQPRRDEQRSTYLVAARRSHTRRSVAACSMTCWWTRTDGAGLSQPLTTAQSLTLALRRWGS